MSMRIGLGLRLSRQPGLPNEAAAPVNVIAPVISGETEVGSILTVSNGSWTGNPAPTFAYQWRESSTNIPGETAQTYVSELAGDVIDCVVTATNSEGSASQASSNSVTVTAAWETNLALAASDSWTSLYDPENPNTRTLRTVGADDFVPALASGVSGPASFAQATEAAQPKMVDGVLVLSGTKWMTLGTDTVGATKLFAEAAQSFTAFVAFKTTVANGTILSRSGASNRTFQMFSDINGDLFVTLRGAPNNVEVGITDGVWRVAMVRWDGSAAVGRVNKGGEVALTVGAAAENVANIEIGSRTGGAALLNGSIGSVVICDFAMTVAEQDRCFDALMAQLPLEITALRGITMDAATQSDLFTKDADGVQEQASIVKLMTALVSQEWISDWNASVTVEAGDMASGSTAQLQAGDVLTLEAVLHGLLLPSGNDASRVLGRVVGQMILDFEEDEVTAPLTRFVTEMNTKAAALGLTNTAYGNTSGTDGVGNQSSARDTARLMLTVAADSYLLGIAGTLTYTMVITGANARSYGISHTIDPAGAVAFPEFVGGKTGTTTNAGACAVMVWDDGSANRYVSVVLNSDSANRFVDLRALIDDVLP